MQEEQNIKPKVKIVNIEIPKQDYTIIPFVYMRNGERTKLDDNDLIYMTTREDYSSKEIVFQKSLGNGITYNNELERYEIEINSNDTAQLMMNNDYGYDITIFYDGNKPKQKVVGQLKIGKKYTLNEVV